MDLGKLILVLILLPVFAVGCVTVSPGGGGAECPVIDDLDLVDDSLEFEVEVDRCLATELRVGSTTGQEEALVCDGWYPAAPNHTLVVDGSFGMAVRVTADQKSRLRIVCEQSNFCGSEVDVDVWELSRFWTPIVCDVYVGTAELGGELEYTLEFIQN